MVLELSTVELDDDDLQSFSEETRKRVRQRYVNKVNDLAKLLLEAYQSKIPVDTGELRDQRLTLHRATIGNPVAEIDIRGSHYGRDRKLFRGGAGELAILLNDGNNEQGRPMRRSQASWAIEPYSSIGRRKSTANWVDSARRAFDQVKGRYLSADI